MVHSHKTYSVTHEKNHTILIDIFEGVAFLAFVLTGIAVISVSDVLDIIIAGVQ